MKRAEVDEIVGRMIRVGLVKPVEDGIEIASAASSTSSSRSSKSAASFTTSRLSEVLRRRPCPYASDRRRGQAWPTRQLQSRERVRRHGHGHAYDAEQKREVAAPLCEVEMRRFTCAAETERRPSVDADFLSVSVNGTAGTDRARYLVT